MWGIVGKKGNTIGTEDAVQLLSCSLLNEKQSSSWGVIWIIAHGYPAWFVSSANSGQAYRCLWHGLYVLSKKSVSLLCPGWCKPESWAGGGTGGLSLLPAGSEQLLWTWARLPQQSVWGQAGRFLKNWNRQYSGTDDKLLSMSFTSHWKLQGQLIHTFKILFECCYHRYAIWCISIWVCYLTMT